MKEVETTLSIRYAKAFLDVFKSDISDQTIEKVKQVVLLFQNNQPRISLLSLPLYSKQDQYTLLSTLLVEKAQLPNVFANLIDLLVKHRRASLITTVLHKIVVLYYQRNNISSFSITSSYELEESQLQSIQQFLAVQTGSVIIYTYTIDSDLIAGIRLQSTTNLWEYSVRKSIEAIRINFMEAEH